MSRLTTSDIKNMGLVEVNGVYRKVKGAESENKGATGRKQAKKDVFTAKEWNERQSKPQNRDYTGKEKEYIEAILNELGITFCKEHKFAPDRKFRFDFCILIKKVAIEYEGIFSKKSRHTTISGYSKDSEKYNLSAQLGWTVYRYTALTYKNVEADLKREFGL